MRIIIAAGLVAFSLFSAASEGEIDFNRDIRPILSDKCFFCHGPDSHERKADLRLDTAEGAFMDLGGYAAIVPGAPEKSEAVSRMNDRDDPMPPADSHKKLSPGEIELVTRWIAEGAAYSEPWAYVAPKQHPVPDIANPDWAVNWIDHFVLKRLEDAGIEPSRDAEKVTLVRRLHFDLTGLPPSPAVVDEFVAGEVSVPDLVDRLLDSPHFGERLAMYWLDLVRYADTVGYHGDQEHNISPYRDYVIRSFNRNLSFDQFSREQIAGDLLESPTKWQKVASGYNRLLQTSHEGGIQKKEYDEIYAADRVRNLSAVWMGATVGCAQCHDHKYDPYTIHDHYALAAFFADVHDEGYNGNGNPTNRPPEMVFFSDKQEADLLSVKRAMEQLAGKKLWSQIQQNEARLRSLEESLLVGKGSKKAIEKSLVELRKQTGELFPVAKREEWKRLQQRREDIVKNGRRTMITVAKEPRKMRLLPRGDWQDDSGPVMQPAIPEFLGAINCGDSRANRLDLVNWLTDTETGIGGLTARVFANRFWYLFLGQGISPSLDDFGGQGQPPSHPRLLDNLAVAFYQSGWDIKHLIRLIVLSRTYQQSSIPEPGLVQKDPLNQWFSRQNRFRLPAEMIRDNALSISGLLIDEFGGVSVRPYQPAKYYRHLNFPTRTYKHNEDLRQWRRGVYVHWQRMFLHPMLKAMDAPSREECTAQRPRSNTPTAALVLLNDPTFVEAARVFAQKIINEGGPTVDSRLNYACRLAQSRRPDSEERKILTRLLEDTKRDYQAAPEEAEKLLSIGLSPPGNAAASIELASWTSVARALFNLNETMNRN